MNTRGFLHGPWAGLRDREICGPAGFLSGGPGGRVRLRMVAVKGSLLNLTLRPDPECVAPVWVECSTGRVYVGSWLPGAHMLCICLKFLKQTYF